MDRSYKTYPYILILMKGVIIYDGFEESCFNRLYQTQRYD